MYCIYDEVQMLSKNSKAVKQYLSKKNDYMEVIRQMFLSVIPKQLELANFFVTALRILPEGLS
jgi:hypothetical protein